VFQDKEQEFSLLTIRFRWFVLQAGAFLKRNQMGILIVLFLLPGVAVLENLVIFYRFLATPFLQVVDSEVSLPNRVLAWISVLVIFLSWAKSQEQAIKGGAFAIYLKSIPIKRIHWLIADAVMLLLSNHLLWVLLISPLLLPDIGGVAHDGLYYLNTLLLVLSLLLAQWFLIFQSLGRAVAIWALGALLYLFLMPWLGGAAAILSLGLLIYSGVVAVQPESSKSRSHWRWKPLNRTPFWLSFYLQMLFKSVLASTLMRLGLCLLTLMGFAQLHEHLLSLNNGHVKPFIQGLVACWAYWLSGLYVKFQDIRGQYQGVFQSMPFARAYWFIRDYAVLAVLALLIFVLAWLVLPGQVPMVELISVHLGLLLLVYPLRSSGKNHQPFTSFVVALVVTVLWIALRS